MTGRDPAEGHRQATPLELLYDLCFVVAVALAAEALHHDLAENHVTHGVVSFLVVFFAIWWPWVNFTWFASAYDTDDVLYRLLTFVQIAGVLVVAAGVPSAFEALDFRVMVVGYVIMRIALVGQWLRVAREDPGHRRTAVRFAGAIALIQLLWIGRLALDPTLGFIAFLVFGVLELLVPVWAESAGRPTPWHPGHITERYGLFTIIVIGECVLAATMTIEAAFTAGGLTAPLLTVAVAGLLLVFGLWWMYFKDSMALGRGSSLRSAISWSYAHYAIFASVAAVGAGLQVAAESTQHALELPDAAVAASVGVPAALYLSLVALLHRRSDPVGALRSVGPLALLMLAAAAAAPWIGVPLSVLAMALVLVALIGSHVVGSQRGRRAGERRATAE